MAKADAIGVDRRGVRQERLRPAVPANGAQRRQDVRHAGRDERASRLQVLTGAMFDILIELAKHYRRQPEEPPTDGEAASPVRKRASPAQAFWRAADRMQRTAIQPLDLLPPVDVTFRDYAIAVCRSQQLADPIDPHDYYGMLIKVFRKREILSAEDERRLKQPQYLYDRLRLCVHHDIGDISRSRAAAYRFLDDNRQELLIPANQDFFIADLYDANKRVRQAARLPRQIILEYVWREDVLLAGKRFGQFDGQPDLHALRRNPGLRRQRQRPRLGDEARLPPVRGQAGPGRRRRRELGVRGRRRHRAQEGDARQSGRPDRRRTGRRRDRLREGTAGRARAAVDRGRGGRSGPVPLVAPPAPLT